MVEWWNDGMMEYWNNACLPAGNNGVMEVLIANLLFFPVHDHCALYKLVHGPQTTGLGRH